MQLDKKLFAQLLNQATQDGITDNMTIAERVANSIQRINTIVCKKLRIDKMCREAKTLYDHTIGQYKIELYELQKTCKHEQFSFYSDPAGGNDSYHKCDICGKEW